MIGHGSMDLPHSEWTLDYTSFIPELEKTTETLCTVGNGYFGTRGAFEESKSSKIHYPGTYIAGVYNRLESEVGGRIVENEDFPNCPNWTFLTFKIDDGAWFDITNGEILDYYKQINFKKGELVRSIRFKDKQGNITHIKSVRFVSMNHAHLAGLRYSVTPENYSGEITIRSALDGNLSNEGIERYKELNSLHLEKLEEGFDDTCIYLSVKTNQSDITISQAAKNSIVKNGNEETCSSTYETNDRFVAQDFSIHIKDNETVTLDKIIALYTSRDTNISDPLFSAKEYIKSSDNFDLLHKIHCKEWEALWKKMDIVIEGGEDVQKVLRFHAYHLLTTASFHTAKNDASVPARGLHGEAYRGHIFWDELFIFPFYNLHFPEITRSLLLYRYRRLDKALEYAKEYGYKGAMYPWQSGSDGREETQIIHLNPNSGEWGDDYSSLQRHVSLAVAYNVWMYYWMTDDTVFMAEYGAEMIFEIARFWASKCTLNNKTGKYEIHHVMGPDEYHEKYPDSEKGGVKDNAYTNVFCVWTMKKCLDCIAILSESEFGKIKSKINLLDEEISLWENIISKMNIVARDDIISQYDGFLDLKELDWDGYRKKYQNIARLDRILKAEGLSPDDYQLSKQADLLMLFYIFPAAEVGEIFRNLGCKFDDTILQKNYHYYLERTSHGSTLSLLVHSRVAALFNDMKQSMEWFQKALTADISDIQEGTVKEGIHAGLMAGTIHIFLASFVGLSFFKEKISFNPKIPPEWKKVAFNGTFKNVHYTISIESSKLTIQVDSTAKEEVSIQVAGKDYSLSIGKMEEITF